MSTALTIVIKPHSLKVSARQCLGTAVVALFSTNLSAQSVALETLAANAPQQVPAFDGQTRAPEQRAEVSFKVETVAEGL